jgi:hypothetical protein
MRLISARILGGEGGGEDVHETQEHLGDSGGTRRIEFSDRQGAKPWILPRQARRFTERFEAGPRFRPSVFSERSIREVEDVDVDLYGGGPSNRVRRPGSPGC